jgi:CubicO group peptidase (beta-lactamase class C family)
MEEFIPQIDELFAPWDHTRSPGCALAVIRESQIVYQRGYGMASLEFGVPITPKTVFQIGSISKQFTAMAIAILAEEGKISLEDDVRKYVPEVPDFGDMITIRHLVHHTSGLRGIDELFYISGNRIEDVTLVEDYLEYLPRQRGLNFKPGEKHLYCNTGYTLMALIVERVSGKSMREFCDERLFKPLGMKHTVFQDDYKSVISGFAQSYSPAGPGKFQKEYLTHGLPGSTSLLTTVQDLLYWDQEFYDGRVVGKTVIDQVHQQGVLNNGETIDYAFGISINQYRGLKTVSHGGSDAGFRSVLLRFPDQRCSVVILSNLGSFSPDGLARKVADLVLVDDFTEETPVKEEAVEVSLPEEFLKQKAGLYYNPDSEVGTSYDLAVRDGKLTILLGPGFPLTPVGEDLFVLSGFDAMKFRIAADEKGSSTLTLLAEDIQIPYARVPKAELPEDELELYTGRYYSDEMDAYYIVGKCEGGLGLRLKKHGEFPLQPTIQDGFSLDLSAMVGMPYSLSILFYREGDSIAGMYVSSGRAKDIQFVHQ